MDRIIRFWILDFGFWIGRARLFRFFFASFAPLREPSSSCQDPKPKIQNWAILFILSILLPFSTALAKEPVTIYLAGDSTCADKQADKRPETGWGEMLGAHFKPGKVRIDNRAMNGRSTKTFISEGRWQAIIDALKKGDYVFIQFGHNDESKDKGERYTPPEDYRKNLIRFIEEVRAKKATPVLLTPVMRRRFNEKGEFYDTHGEYPDIVRAVATEYKTALIDMHRKSEAVIKQYGPEGSKKLFLQLKPGENPNYPKGIEDNTHFNPAGAEEMAKLVAEGIREQKLGLMKYLRK
jgi:lysophospholipase L1-like esterase